MDDTRKIRFWIPPLVVLFYVALAGYQDAHTRSEIGCWLSAHFDALEPIVGTVVALTSILLVSGYVLGTIVYVAMRVSAALLGRGASHEAWFTKAEALLVWKAVVGTSELQTAELMFATVWLDFVHLPNEVHSWIVRRWNAFNLSANTAFGTMISMVIVPCLTGITPGCSWYGIGGAIIGVFGINAALAYIDTKRMLVFFAEHKDDLSASLAPAPKQPES